MAASKPTRSSHGFRQRRSRKYPSYPYQDQRDMESPRLDLSCHLPVHSCQNRFEPLCAQKSGWSHKSPSHVDKHRRPQQRTPRGNVKAKRRRDARRKTDRWTSRAFEDYVSKEFNTTLDSLECAQQWPFPYKFSDIPVSVPATFGRDSATVDVKLSARSVGDGMILYDSGFDGRGISAVSRGLCTTSESLELESLGDPRLSLAAKPSKTAVHKAEKSVFSPNSCGSGKVKSVIARLTRPRVEPLRPSDVWKRTALHYAPTLLPFGLQSPRTYLDLLLRGAKAKHSIRNEQLHELQLWKSSPTKLVRRHSVSHLAEATSCRLHPGNTGVENHYDSTATPPTLSKEEHDQIRQLQNPSNLWNILDDDAGECGSLGLAPAEIDGRELPYVHPNSLAGLDNRSQAWHDIIEQPRPWNSGPHWLMPLREPDMGLNELGVAEDVYPDVRSRMHSSSGSVHWTESPKLDAKERLRADTLPEGVVNHGRSEATGMTAPSQMPQEENDNLSEEWVWYNSSDDAEQDSRALDDSVSTASFLSYDDASDDVEREMGWVLEM